MLAYAGKVNELKAVPFNQTKRVESFHELVSIPAAATPHKELFRIRNDCGGYDAVTWKEFEQDIAAFGAALDGLGVLRERVCILSENSYEWVLSLMSVVCAGGIVVPVDKDLPLDEMQNIITDCGAKALVFSPSYITIVHTMAEGLPGIERFICTGGNEGGFDTVKALIQGGKGQIKHGTNPYEQNPVPANQAALIIYTSGTTGFCKGVLLSQQNLISDITAAAAMVHCGRDDVVLSILPLNHTYELSCGILAVMLCEGIICFNDSLRRLGENLKLFQPTLVFLVPLIAETLYKRVLAEAEKAGKTKKLRKAIKISGALTRFGIDIKKILFKELLQAFGGRLEKIVVGGAPMKPDISRAYGDIGITVLQGYGITECSPLVSVNREKANKPESVGLPVPCCEVKIKDDEILVKGDNVMLGYYNNPAATEAAFHNGWFRTGDMGYIDKDGFLYVTGRKKNLIVLESGKNVNPEEIEEYLLRIPEIIETVVYEENKVVTAEIYPNYEVPDTEKSIREQIEALNDRIPKYKRIHSIKFRDYEFEKTTSKKIKRYKI